LRGKKPTLEEYQNDEKKTVQAFHKMLTREGKVTQGAQEAKSLNSFMRIYLALLFHDPLQLLDFLKNVIKGDFTEYQPEIILETLRLAGEKLFATDPAKFKSIFTSIKDTFIQEYD